jgi:hypothetical protein
LGGRKNAGVNGSGPIASRMSDGIGPAEGAGGETETALVQQNATIRLVAN